MDTPFLAMVILFGGNFPIRGWSLCWGQILSIAQNTALFSLLGTTYGGNGQTTFALPDLRGRVPRGMGQGPGLSNIDLGQVAGTESITLIVNNIPAHNHTASGAGLTVAQSASTAAGTSHSPGNTLVPAVLPTIGGGPSGTAIKGYAVQDNTTTLATSNVGGTLTTNLTGGSQPFTIMNPYLGMNYQIALNGIFPSRN